MKWLWYFVGLETRQHLDMHIFRKHRTHAPTLEKAKEISAEITRQARVRKSAAPVGSIKYKELAEWYGAERWKVDGIGERTIALLEHFNIQVVEDAEPTAEPVVPEVEQEFLPDAPEREPETVKALKKKYGLYEQVESEFPVVASYKATRLELRKDPKSCENSCRRLRMIFAHARKQCPGKSPWELLIEQAACYDYLVACREKCGVLPATLLTFAKDMACTCDYARERWSSKPDMPKTDEYREKLKSVHVFWKDKEKVLQEETEAAKNAKLSTGTAKVADLNRLYEYIEDEAVVAAVDTALDRLESLQRVMGRVKITQQSGDTANHQAWNLVVRFLMVSALIQNASRTGVVENMTVPEFSAANKLRGRWIIQVAKHKRAKDGAAKIRIYEAEYARWSRFVEVRKKMPVKKPNGKLMFVTIHGQPFKTVTESLNRWNSEKGYESVTVNMIRRVTSDAAAAQGMDVQTDVPRHMAHSLATAEWNYRSKNLDASVRGGDAVQLVQENYRCIKLVSANPAEYFANDQQFPSHEELQNRFRKFLKNKSFKLTQKTYNDLQDMYDAER